MNEHTPLSQVVSFKHLTFWVRCYVLKIILPFILL